MRDKLTQKQETFCLNLFQGMYQREAYIDAYHPKYALATIDANASRLAKNEKVLARLEELKQLAVDASVMGVLERKQRLSEIARGRIVDFVECGADGSFINVGLESCHSAAIQEVKSHTEYDENGANATVITKLKLHDPVKAVVELNKMEHIYSENGISVGDINVVFVIGKGYKGVPQLTRGKEDDNDQA